MYKKIIFLHLKDLFLNLNYWWQTMICIFIGNLAFLGYTINSKSALLINLFCSYISIFIFSVGGNISDIAATEKFSSRLDVYLANGITPKKACMCYSISSFFLSFVTVLMLSISYFLRIYIFNNEIFSTVFFNKNWILLIDTAWICFFLSLLLNEFVFFLRNPIFIRFCSMIVFFVIFFSAQYLSYFCVKNNFSYVILSDKLFLLSLIIGIVTYILFLFISTKLKKERIILTKY